jgi:lambda family phage tail tape measure protein
VSDDFTFQIKADPSDALSAEDKVGAGLDKLTGKAKQTGAALNEAFQDKNGRWRDAEGRFLSLGQKVEMVGDKAVITGEKVANAGKKMGDAAKDAENHVGNLIALAAAYVSGHELMELADGYTEISNRLRIVSIDHENLNGLMEATLGIAQDTRMSWDTVTNTYQRLSNVTHGLGLSQRQVLDLTEEMAKGAKISGASTQEASMAMSELNHAFSTGALQGREYRVLMRDVPSLMHELQVASGKTGAEFAEMGKHGKISASLLIDWFGKANDSINDKFGQTIPTMADEFTMLHNAAEQFFGETATGTGILEGIRNVLNYIIQHFETFGKILLGVGEALIGLYVISKVISLVQQLSAAIVANPLMALVTAITLAVSLLRQFGDELNIDSKGVMKMSDVLGVLWQYIKDIGSSIYEFLDGAWKSLSGAFSDGLDSQGIELSLKNILLFIASFVDAGIALFKILGHAIAGAFATAFLGIAEGFQGLVNDMIDALNVVVGFGANIGKSYALQRQYDHELANFKDRNDRGPNAQEKKDLLALAQHNSDENNMLAGGGNSMIGHINLVDDGGAGRAWKAMKEDMNKDLTTSTTKDLVEKFFDDVEKHANERVKNVKKPPGSYISDATNAKDAPAEDEKAIKAAEKLFNQLREVVEQSNPVSEAQQKIAHAQEIVNKAMTSGSPKIAALLAQYGGAGAIMDEYRKKLDEQLHPYETLITKLTEEVALLQMSTEAQKRAADVEKARLDLKQKGVIATDAQVNSIVRLTNMIERQKELNKDETESYQKLFGATKAYATELTGLDLLYQHNKISASQYADAVDRARSAFLEGSAAGKTIEGGMERAWLQIKLDVEDVGTVIKTTFVNAFASVENALVELVTKGSIDWHQMVESMLADLTRLLERQALIGLIGAVTGGGGGAAAAGSLASMPGIADPFPHAAGGNQWTVGGTGAQDSQLVAFRASPGERVTVDHGANTSSRLNNDQSGGGGAPVSIHVLNDHRAIVAAMNTPDARRVMLSTYQQADRYNKPRMR